MMFIPVAAFMNCSYIKNRKHIASSGDFKADLHINDTFLPFGASFEAKCGLIQSSVAQKTSKLQCHISIVH